MIMNQKASRNDQEYYIVINDVTRRREINDKKEHNGYEMNAPDCSNNVTEKCGVVNNNMSNNVEGEILEDHFDGDSLSTTLHRRLGHPGKDEPTDLNQLATWVPSGVLGDGGLFPGSSLARDKKFRIFLQV
ncbi:hypothetical protein Tco_1146165 [Tanacetum coccineum]